MHAIILSGLQGAGKSTFCRDRFWNSHLRINLDMLRTRHREAILLQACLASKQPFVVDATNPTVHDRSRYVGPAVAAGFVVIGYQFHIDPEFAIARTVTRGGAKRVPEKAIYATLHKLEPLAFAEGFAAINDVFVVGETLRIEERDRAV